MTNKVLIIAEAGVNHNGDENLALQLIDKAADAGADIVKFQTFRTENLVTKTAKLASYQKANGVNEDSQFDMLKKLELSVSTYHKLLSYCDEKNITFLSTAFDLDSLSFLLDELKLSTLKIPSGEVTNAPLVLAHARSGCNLIVSTGMCSLNDIEQTLGVIALGLLNFEGKMLELPLCTESFSKAFHSKEGVKLLANKVTLLHCTTEYPAPMNDINLKAMHTMSKTFALPIGYSDHSAGITIPIAAVARGACVIEKHFTLDKTMAGPDHKASLEPDELKSMVSAIRDVESALGDGIKEAAKTEIKNISVARKSLVAASNIKAGESFSTNNLTIKRPGNGISPYHFWSMLETKAKKDYEEGDLI